MDDLIQLIFAVLSVLAGLIFGRAAERKHYQSIMEREARYLSLPVRANGRFTQEAQDATLVMGNVVIASDRFKALVASLKSFFGGNLHSYESLLDRGRREAVLRLKEQAIAWGAKEVVNLRVESSTLDAMGVEIFATGTAIK